MMKATGQRGRVAQRLVQQRGGLSLSYAWFESCHAQWMPSNGHRPGALGVTTPVDLLGSSRPVGEAGQFRND